MDIHGKRSKEGHRCLLLSDYDFQREIQTRKALYGYVKYSQRKSYWEAMEKVAYSPLKVAKFCSDMYSGIQFLPDHRSYPRGLFTETQWNSAAESPLQRSVRKYYMPKIQSESTVRMKEYLLYMSRTAHSGRGTTGPSEPLQLRLSGHRSGLGGHKSLNCIRWPRESDTFPL